MFLGYFADVELKVSQNGYFGHVEHNSAWKLGYFGHVENNNVSKTGVLWPWRTSQCLGNNSDGTWCLEEEVVVVRYGSGHRTLKIQ